MLYILILIVIIYFTYHFDYLGNIRYRDFCYYSLLTVFVLLAGLRYRIGVDSIRYEEVFKYVSNLYEITEYEIIENEERLDPLYALMSSLAKTISNDFWVLQLIQSLLVNTILFRFVRKNTKNLFFAILLYYIVLYANYMCEVMREACAVSMFLLAWEYFKSNKWIRFYLFSLLAFFFHTSAIVLFVLPIFNFLKIDKLLDINTKTTIFVLLGIVICGFIIQSNFYEYIQIYSINDSLSEKISRYKRKETLSGAIFNWKGIISVAIRYVLYPIWAVITLKYSKKISPKLATMVSWSLFYSMLMIPIAIFYRFNNYFLPFTIIAISEFAFLDRILSISGKLVIIKGYVTWILIFFPLLFVHSYEYFSEVDKTGLKDYMRYYPYYSVISPEEDDNRERLFRYHGAY